MTAEELLLVIDPIVPALGMDLSEDWSHMRPLSRDVKEFGWEGTKKLPSVRRMLAAVESALRRKAR